MGKSVKVVPKERKTKADGETKRDVATRASGVIRLGHLISDSGTAITCAEAKIMGTVDPELAGQLGDQLCNSLWWPENATEKDRLHQMTAAVAALAEIRPRNVVEGMLAVQMIATHNAAMESFRRAMVEGQSIPGRELNLKHAEKLVRIYREHMEAMQRIRAKSQSKHRRKQADIKSKGQTTLKRVA